MYNTEQWNSSFFRGGWGPQSRAPQWQLGLNILPLISFIVPLNIKFFRHCNVNKCHIHFYIISLCLFPYLLEHSTFRIHITLCIAWILACLCRLTCMGSCDWKTVRNNASRWVTVDKLVTAGVTVGVSKSEKMTTSR